MKFAPQKVVPHILIVVLLSNTCFCGTHFLESAVAARKIKYPITRIPIRPIIPPTTISRIAHHSNMLIHQLYNGYNERERDY